MRGVTLLAILVFLVPGATLGHVIPDDEICITIPEIDGTQRLRDEVAILGFSFVPPNADTFDDASSFQCHREETLQAIYAEINRLQALINSGAQVGSQNIHTEAAEIAKCEIMTNLGLRLPAGCAQYGY